MIEQFDNMIWYGNNRRTQMIDEPGARSAAFKDHDNIDARRG